LSDLIALPQGSTGTVVPWSGTAFRFAGLKYADVSRFTDGEGAKKSGGRFTPTGGMRTLYLSCDRATATAELDSFYDYFSIPAVLFEPRLLAAVEVRLGTILNLIETSALTLFGLTTAHLFEEWRLISHYGGVAPTQLFGRLVADAGFEGILYPSARHANGMNLAIFPENYHAGSASTMLNPP